MIQQWQTDDTISPMGRDENSWGLTSTRIATMTTTTIISSTRVNGGGGEGKERGGCVLLLLL
jgi:hypothetical protein